jgi:hypothetical protein
MIGYKCFKKTLTWARRTVEDILCGRQAIKGGTSQAIGGVTQVVDGDDDEDDEVGRSS